ncbi:periplasmic chaperone for outer membrane proteins Skp [Bacteroides faecichinchillae]|uniref:Periplasmic chaperone for outer membrane proteins Skp n=1 Tax=Bacteroides faecichinchillae TaxID=871325 RepID=A0A1M4UF89_9BACE|nr:OmpH family outer membrane protein [Bacteroides faecichinchillae]THG69701.1 OmpH family outer membrane protein [Bacteroides faecichinchillae]SHE55334.1 periplasmic chaperone for outer membrane proteins Skp [Bacteroides faecichinchillae]
MRKSILSIMLLFAISMAASAQKFALIDTEYILKNIPAYQSANEQLQEATKKYQAEIEAIVKETQKMFQDYQAKATTLSADQKIKKEDEIVAKEKAAAELRRTYFGPEGELVKMREELIAPIEDDIYDVVKELSQLHGYDLVMDRASSTGIIFANPQIDISDEVLRKLGYSN